MGEAARRKKLDPAYGSELKEWKKPSPVKSFGRRQSDGRFQIALIDPKEFASEVKARVVDTQEGREAIVDFNLYTEKYKGSDKLYAQAQIAKDKAQSDGWVGENIDTISPLICEAVTGGKKFVLSIG
jgi:hypothetical protein